MPDLPKDFHCPYAEAGKDRCPAWRCDCFVDIYPEDPFGLHPEMYVVHIPQLDGSCVISVAGQGHLPCDLHQADTQIEPPERTQTDPAVRTVRKTMGRPVEDRNLLDE